MTSPSSARSGPWPRMQATSRCPCQSGETYATCCGPLHYGVFHSPSARAATAERLMRSRYSAFVVGDARYLLHSWHPRTRPVTLDLDPAQRWFGLQIVRTAGGGMLETTGRVEFRASFRLGSRVGEQHETSIFSRVDGRWVYVDGV